MFVSSALYHWLRLDHQWLQRMDHAAIYVMIAGSYTPVALLGLPGVAGWVVLGLQWGLALVGVAAAATRDKTPTPLRLTLYLVMGWMIVVLVPQVLAATSPATVAWMVAGGVSYTVGAIVYASKRPQLWPGKFGFHELWHVFVLGGAACHLVVMITLYSLLR
jgi:hemolysin III